MWINWYSCVYCWCAKSLQSCLTLCNRTGRHAPLSMEFSRQEYRSGLPFPSSEDLANPGIEPVSLISPALQVGSLPLVTPMNVKLWSHCGKLAVPQNIKYRITVWSSNSILRYICKRIENRYSNYACPWMFIACYLQ